jgi:uncharacterized membrane protein YbhN (UPF0104 family)
VIRRRLSSSFRLLGLLAALGFGAYAIASQAGKIGPALHRVGVVAPVLSFVIAVVGLAASALSWRALLADLGVPLPLPVATRVFFVGQLGKYLPGGFWPVVAQMELGRDAGAGRRQVGTAAFLVMAVNVLTGLLVAVLCLPLASASALHRAGWLLVLLPVGLVAFHPRVIGGLINRGLRVLRREPLERLPTARGLLVGAGWSLVMWACYGAHMYVLARPVAEAGHRLPLLAAGAYSLAWSVGFLLVIAPAGAGAREAVLVGALSPAMPVAAATTVALISRLAMTVADFGYAGAALAVSSRGEPSRDPARPAAGRTGPSAGPR